ncbi:MAG: Deoxyuridine 5'-triphosphate nucleotidohydrolase [Chlamydiae bacterium]|nr:Deoxyuridine 5'-triphosphate nucleotidohydrolase [Chlamydiota bacterium]
MKKQPVMILIEDQDQIPFYGSVLAAGADVRAANREEILIAPRESALIPTGIRLEIPDGYEIQIRPRSGLAFKNQITVLNTPGTIDADYRGELKILLINHGNEPFTVTYGMRIAQIVLAEVTQAEFIVKEALAATERGEGGFGHTGTH